MALTARLKSMFRRSSSVPPPSTNAKDSTESSERMGIEQPMSPEASSSQPKPLRVKSRTNASDGRPQPLQRIPSVQTRYMEMLLSQDSIPRVHNILASFFQWIMLAGYLVLPATFNSIENSSDVQSYSNNGNAAAKAALTVVKNVPFLYVGAFCAGIGLIGKVWLYFEHRGNYVWLVNKIFM